MPFFAFPIGSGDVKPSIGADRVAASGLSLAIRGTESTAPSWEALSRPLPLFGPDCFDYVYSIEKLATFSGKKLHGKRNFCNRFEKEHSWEFKRLTPQLMPWCMGMLGEWHGDYGSTPDGLDDEHAAIVRRLHALEGARPRGRRPLCRRQARGLHSRRGHLDRHLRRAL
ncbi:MAG: phosphatidylglycerol lysyltransferase domain-containing protein [Oscillospiraceae bacterium]